MGGKTNLATAILIIRLSAIDQKNVAIKLFTHSLLDPKSIVFLKVASCDQSSHMLICSSGSDIQTCAHCKLDALKNNL
jgi:hypothetical protein